MIAGALSHDLSFTEDKPIPGPKAVDLPMQPGTGQWPRMLNLDEETRERLSRYLDDEIQHCLSEREMLVADWERWQADYWATPKGVKNFPFERAANIIIPLTAIAVEAIYSRLLNTIFSVKPFWSIRPKALPWVDVAPQVEKWLQTEVENESSLNIYAFASNALMEFVKLGTAVSKSGYEREVKKSLRQLANGREEEVWTESKNGAVVYYVPLANFLMRLSENDPQSAPWAGEEHEFSWSQLKRMALSGRMDPKELEKLKAYWATSRVVESGSGMQYQQKLDEHIHTEPMWNDKFPVKEIWLSFDVDGDNIDEEIVVDYHKPSKTFLSIRYNWYADLRRPYRVGQFIPVEGRWVGIGIGKQNEQFQEEVTTIHRQRLDNATLANMRMLKVKRGLGYGADEPIFPGKMWFVNDYRDVEPFQMSEVYPSSYSNEQTAQFYSDKRTGVNDVMLGVPQQGTPGTATDMLTRLAEGNKKFDMVLRNVRRWFSYIGQDVLANFQQFGAQERHWLILGDKGIYVEQMLRMPAQLVMQGAIVELTVTDSITNRQVEQQQWMGLFQIITQYYQQVITLSQLIQNPQITLTLAQRALSASDFAARRLFESFAIVDYEPLLLLAEERNGGNAAQPTGNGGPPADNGPSGLEGLTEIVRPQGGAAATGGGSSVRF
jgi:hypothetical protein